MVATSFLTASNASKEAYKTANLLKSLSVNALIGGEHGTGKTALARSILPDAPFYEVPLIRAGMKRFKSQLQLAERLGLNRNTLRKKISEYHGLNLEVE